MAETPFEPFFDGGPGRDSGRRGGAGRVRPYQRSFRCRTALRRRPDERVMDRYAGFVALHEAISEPPVTDLRRLWWCGLAAAVAAGGLAAIAVLMLRGLLGLPIPVFVSGAAGTGSAAVSYAVCAAAMTVQATALLHVLVATAARPLRAFCWIGGIVVGLVALLPLLLDAPLGALLATSGINLVGGTAVVTVLALVAAETQGWDEPPFPGARDL
ncbi:hypothetical protein [Actinomadura hibisca]|uniref:hypothetical protein n=1 Tax=Actinomadura hibisca TaxID=68565 RepID=UPI000A061A9D|nr:hypothetical protein [Actinomadura hibisca]